MHLQKYVTIDEIQEEVPVSDRTIRNWVLSGLLARTILTSEGYKCGVKGLYAADSIDKAKLLSATPYLSLEDRKKMIEKQSRYSSVIEEDGTIVITIKAKTAERKNYG